VFNENGGAIGHLAAVARNLANSSCAGSGFFATSIRRSAVMPIRHASSLVLVAGLLARADP